MRGYSGGGTKTRQGISQSQDTREIMSGRGATQNRSGIRLAEAQVHTQSVGSAKSNVVKNTRCKMTRTESVIANEIM